jgi:PAS domain S-box-containing protein
MEERIKELELEIIRLKKELAFQNEENEKRAAELNIASKEKEKEREKLIINNEILNKLVVDRKQVEDELRESENKYRMIAENTADLIWSMDLNLNLTYVSPSSYRLRGYTVEEAMLQTIDQIITPDSLQKALVVFEEQLTLFKKNNGEEIPSVCIELEHYKKDGSIINTENSVAFLLDEKKQAIGILGVTRDITERKQAEEKILIQLEELKRWQEITLGREDRNRQLKQEVNELLTRFGEPIRYPSVEADALTNPPG